MLSEEAKGMRWCAVILLSVLAFLVALEKLFGGENLGDTWAFDGAVWKLTIASGAPGSPGARSDAAMGTLP